MPLSDWSTQQLAEFLSAVSSAHSEESAATVAVERAAEALDAEVAAIVRGGEVLACVGYPEEAAAPDDLCSVRPGMPTCELAVPGLGVCVGNAVALEYPSAAVFVVARSAPAGLTREEAALVRGMARVTSLTMQMLRLLDAERAARESSERHAADNARLLATQAALRRVATLVARAVPAEGLFDAVTEEVGGLLPADSSAMVCFDAAAGTTTVVASWSATGATLPIGTRQSLEGHYAAALVYERRTPVRIDDYANTTGGAAALARDRGWRSSVATPIVVQGRLWGAMLAASTSPERLPPDTEERLADFTELVATAIANAESRAELTASRARIVATADETRRRIERDIHDGIQQRLVTLSLELQSLEEDVPDQGTDLAERFGQLQQTLAGVLDELREIARGVHPAILSQGGLGPAIRSVARRATVPVELNLVTVARLPEAVEVAAYYVVCEALANAAKHANASLAYIDVETRDGALHVRIRDNGIGGADVRRGSGIVGLQDRVEALGGSFALHSPPQDGTTVVARLPLEPRFARR